MESAERLKGIIEQQRLLLSALEDERRTLEGIDLAKENAALKANAEKLRAELSKISDDATALSAENKGLKNALAEQMYNERSKLLEAATQKLDIYFRAKADGELNQLAALQGRVTRRINDMHQSLVKHRVSSEEELYRQLDALILLTDKRLTEACDLAASAAPNGNPFTDEDSSSIKEMREAPLTDQQIIAAAKKNNMERMIGLNFLNAAGVFLLLIGAITMAQFTYTRLDNTLKGIMLFALGGIMLAVGEFLNRKAATIFSLGISAGGVAILYAALAASYFLLNILAMMPAVAVCILITATAFILSSRYRSQTIATFALIGGYLPMYSVNQSESAAYGAMVYFIALNLLALLLSLREKWKVTSFLGLALNIFGTAYICFVFSDANDILSKALTIIYTLFTFIIYSAIPLAGSYRAKLPVSKSDIIFLGINTFFSSIMMYGIFITFHLEQFHGALAIAFAATYLWLGRFVETKFIGGNRQTRDLFYLTGLAFVILVVPLQLGQTWLSMGWLAEGVLLTTYGILRGEKNFFNAGRLICGLCLAAFVMFDLYSLRSELFSWKYFAITVGSLVILAALIRAGTMTGHFASVYKYFALINLWIYLMYLMHIELGDLLKRLYSGQDVCDLNYLIGATMVTTTFALAYLYQRIPLLRTGGVNMLSAAMYIVGISFLMLMNTNSSPVAMTYLRAGSPSFGVTIIGTIVLIVLGLLSLFALVDVTRIWTSERKLKAEYVPLIISGYFVVVLSQNLIIQYGLAFSNAALSILYVLTALGWIVLGFMRRYSLLRHFGLGLSIISVIKLFLIDLHTLTEGYRIVSYFALGASLIAISFVYQRFSKRLELREGVVSDVPENR